MIIECTNCHSKYQYNEERFERKPSKKIKCAKCGTIFEIFNPTFASPKPAPAPAPAPAAASAVGDQTFHKKHAPPKPPTDSTTETAQPQPSTGKTPVTLQLPPGKRLSLAIIDGPDAGNVFRLEKPRVTIGRSGADINLNDTEASRQHAAVEVRDTSYTVQDLGSTNGTLIDGVKITAPAELADKGEFVVGNSTIMLIVTEDIG